MTSQTQTVLDVELDVFPKDNGFKTDLHIPASLLQGSADATSGQPGPSLLLQGDAPTSDLLRKGRSTLVIIQLAGINFVTSFSGGLIIVALPAISASLGLPRSLMLWPMSAYALTTASCLLPSGAVADILGTRVVNLVGCFFIASFILISGFAQTGLQLIMFRAMQGIAAALAIPSALSIISGSIESGKRRNVAFATLGLAMPLGYSFGVVLGGVFVTGPGWRVGFYVGGAVSFLLFVVGIWALPAEDANNRTELSVWKRLVREVDWVGAIIASASIALLSYVLATLSANTDNIKKASNIFVLALSIALMPAFVYWMKRQERRGKPALIPNSLWKSMTFTCICIVVLLSNAVADAGELFASLFFQEVQNLSALQASIRILPNVVLGIVTNLSTGVFVNKMPVVYAVSTSCALCAISPLLMAIINPAWPYWYDAFFAMLLGPIAADVIFTVGILIISDVFPAQTQALAGAVFNTLSQVGTSVGLCITQVVSVAVTRESDHDNKSSDETLLAGYRATFWTLFAWMIAACIIGAFGLRKVGKVGEKRD